MFKKGLLGFVFAVTIVSCSNDKKAEQNADHKDNAQEWVDEHTLSNADSVTVKHLNLDIMVDMPLKQIVGKAQWAIVNTHNQKELVLDSYELTIDSVLVDGAPVSFTKDSMVKHLGSALHIPIQSASKQVDVFYKTGKNARALQWLSPEQTHDKRQPFLYTQSEAIYARSWIPCPDGPGIRFTYTARVQVPKGLMAVMSAENGTTTNDSGIYRFSMNTPIPAYLMALAVGELEFRAIDERTGVYAEKGMIDKARYEFENVGKMVVTAEQLYGPYRWGRYDMIVLPPGFPIGGMENPKLTFCTPTIIAGDRSLVSLIAHELAHSWSGNLVTNATWNDFWLNEGFTNYFERRIMEQMMGADYADMLWELGYQDLVAIDEELQDRRDTWLKLDLKDRDPDDGLNDIPYEKGCHFLRMMEKAAGRPRFDSFMVRYFNDHAFKTLTTGAFLAYLDTVLIKGDASLQKKLNISEWVYGPGIPKNCPRAANTLFAKVDAVRTQFLGGVAANSLYVAKWSAHEWLHFLRGMPKTMTTAQMKDLDAAYKLTTTGNAEIACIWYVLSVRNGYAQAYPAMEQFLSAVGRRKFLEPLYRELVKTATGKQMAEQIYTKYRKNYHPIAQEGLDELVLGKHS